MKNQFISAEVGTIQQRFFVTNENNKVSGALTTELIPYRHRIYYANRKTAYKILK